MTKFRKDVIAKLRITVNQMVAMNFDQHSGMFLLTLLCFSKL